MNSRIARFVLLTVGLIVGGAIINIAIAWGYIICIWDGGQLTGFVQSRVGPHEILNITRDETAVTTFVSIERFAARSVADAPDEYFTPNAWLHAPSWLNARDRSPEFELAMKTFGSETIMESRFYLGAGWPTRSLHCQLIRGVSHGGEGLVDEEERGGIRFGDPNSKYWMVNVLPCTPVWRGFVVNTMLYAVGLWMVFGLPFVIRRRVRMKRGQCLACGYSLRDNTSDKCPECGRSAASPALGGSGRGLG